MEFFDQLNRKILLNSTPSRIISLVPSQTELLVDLGLQNKLVGITKFCVHPAGLKTNVPIVGGTKMVNFSKIEALNPDIIICNKEENTEEMVRQLERIAPVWISDIETIPHCLEMMLLLGEVFEVSEKAKTLIASVKDKLIEFQEAIKNVPVKKVIYTIWKNPYMAAGSNTFINALLQINKFENVIENSRYPEVEEKDFKKADLILLSTEPYPFKENDVEELQLSVDAKVQLVDGEYFSWYGSRLIGAMRYFKTLHRVQN